ncbi:hypothetical protein [Halapricum desulfuricans]|uniref:hypothetical protein n=1 Tax=Halapricum desulfuricans TaxID=2841257 RepID=UPI001E2D7A2A|nr:hypothetical protein [Halapricum desulfuricans]
MVTNCGSMLGKILSFLLAPFRWVGKRVSGIRKWIDDPFTNGKIRLPPIFSLSHTQSIASRRQSLILIPLYNLLIGGWSFIFSEVLGRLSHLVKAFFGIGRDYNRGGYNYLGAFLSWCLSVFKRFVFGTVSLLQAIFKMLR